MIRVISKEGTGHDARVVSRNGDNLTDLVGVRSITINMAATEVNTGTAEVYVEEVDVACKRFDWTARAGKGEKLKPLSSMHFRDGTVVRFSECGEALIERPVVAADPGPNDLVMVFNLRTRKWWDKKNNGPTSDLANAGLWRRAEALERVERVQLPERNQLVIETTDEAAARMMREAADPVFIYDKGRGWRSEVVGWTRDINKASRYSREAAVRLNDGSSTLWLVSEAMKRFANGGPDDGGYVIVGESGIGHHVHEEKYVGLLVDAVKRAYSKNGISMIFSISKPKEVDPLDGKVYVYNKVHGLWWAPNDVPDLKDAMAYDIAIVNRWLPSQQEDYGAENILVMPARECLVMHGLAESWPLTPKPVVDKAANDFDGQYSEPWLVYDDDVRAYWMGDKERGPLTSNPTKAFHFASWEVARSAAGLPSSNKGRLSLRHAETAKKAA